MLDKVKDGKAIINKDTDKMSRDVIVQLGSRGANLGLLGITGRHQRDIGQN